MKTDPGIVVLADWHRDNDAIRGVREAVFVCELGIDPALEWDDIDPDCKHWLVRISDGQAIATARCTPALQIGRMAVLPDYRGMGYGSMLLDVILGSADNTDSHWLNAQISAKTFYEQRGFRASGAIFSEAGIPHQRMIYQPGRAIATEES